MIRRVYVDNFRSLVDFTWEPANEMLVLGYNGSGKTTVLDAIDIIRSWAWGWERLDELLPAEQLTRWSDRQTVRLELDCEIQGARFRYRVEFEYDPRTREPKVRTEALTRDDATVFVRNAEATTVHNGRPDAVAKLVVPRKQSAVATVFASDEAELAGEFLTALARMIVVRPMPPLMEPEARRSEFRASPRFENIVSCI